MTLELDPDDPEREQQIRMSIERLTRRNLEDALQAQRGRIVDPAQAADDAVDWFRQDFEQAMSELRFSDEMRDNLRQGMVASSDLGVQVAVRQLDRVGFGFDWALANAAAREWANEYVGRLVAGIDATTERLVRASVTEWIDNGEPLDSLIGELERVFGRERAELIASTEVTRAYAEGNRRAYQESGVVQRWEWRTANDELVCPICGPLNGQQVSIGAAYNGFLPDDVRVNSTFDAPPAHPRCRCWLVPVVEA